jgi:alkanesulfonate monooxygenase SsuD/methylene tetrahydromethanopterin reductase-like flavin-dependent oxidoreductase (luciferase family)
MVGVNVFAADTDAEAGRLFTSLKRQFVNLRRGVPGLLQPPDDALEASLSEMERVGIERMLACSVVGSPETVRRGLKSFIDMTQADEIMVTAQMFDHAARLRSFEIVAGVMSGRETLL